MTKYDNKKKKNSIMTNIQKLRNEIEEIRIQNLTLLENLKPYEKWYDDTKEILFSSSRLRRRHESSHSKSLFRRLSRNQNDSSSSLSSEGSDQEIKFQKYENQESSDYDQDLINEDKLDTKDATINKQVKNDHNPSQKIDFSSLSPFYQNLVINASKQIINQNGSICTIPISNSNHLPVNNSNNNFGTPSTKQNQANNQSQKQNNYISNQLKQNIQYHLRTTPKISQIGSNSMLSNIVSQQKNSEQNDEKNSITLSPQRSLQHAPLTKQFIYIPRKNPQIKNEKSNTDYKNNYNVTSIINMNYNNSKEANTNNNSFFKFDNEMNSNENYINTTNTNTYDTTNIDTKSDENSDDSDSDSNSLINNIDSNESNHTLKTIEENQFNFLIEPPPIPGIQISKHKISDSSEDEDKQSQNDELNKQQTNKQAIITPIISIDLI